MTTLTEKHSPLFSEYPEDTPLMSFGGWEMPRDFTGIIEEHRDVRESAGLFDLSHMGRFIVTGVNAAEELSRLFSRDVTVDAPGRAFYGFFCDEEGGCFDDDILYQRRSNEIWLVVNAGNRKLILDRLNDKLADSKVEDHTEETVLLALQGPDSRDLLAQAAPQYPWPETFFRAEWIEQGMVATTGYTGEQGVELWLEPAEGRELFGRLREMGVSLCGLGARDTLRLEKGYPLHGHELSRDINPLEAGLSRFIDWDHEFTGANSLRKIRDEGPDRKLIGLKGEGRQSPREQYEIRRVEGNAVGIVTSGRFSPTLNRGIGLGLVEADLPGAVPLEVNMRGRWKTFEQVELPIV